MWYRKTHWEPKCKGTDSTSALFPLALDLILIHLPDVFFLLFPLESYSLLAFSCILDTQTNCPGESNIPRINSSIGSQEPRCSCILKTYMRLVSMYRNLSVLPWMETHHERFLEALCPGMPRAGESQPWAGVSRWLSRVRGSGGHQKPSLGTWP